MIGANSPWLETDIDQPASSVQKVVRLNKYIFKEAYCMMLHCTSFTGFFRLLVHRGGVKLTMSIKRTFLIPHSCTFAGLIKRISRGTKSFGVCVACLAYHPRYKAWGKG